MDGTEREATERPTVASEAPERAEARRRLEARRELVSHLVAYVVINTFLVVIWLTTGAGYFWPVWVLGGWGVGLVLHTWETLLRRPITEADVEREMERTQ